MTASTSLQAAMHRDALIAGLGLLLMAVLAGLATFGILERLVTYGDASRTTSDIMAAFGSFQLAILALFGVAVLDVVVAWALWAFFDRVHHTVAVLAALCRGLYAAVFAVAISQLVAAARLLSDGQFSGPADLQLQSKVLAEIQQFDDVWNLGLGLFGLHLLLIGWLAFVSGYVPRFVGLLVGARRYGLPRRQLRQPALREVHPRARLFHLHRRGGVDDLAAAVRYSHAAKPTHQLR